MYIWNACAGVRVHLGFPVAAAAAHSLLIEAECWPDVVLFGSTKNLCQHRTGPNRPFWRLLCPPYNWEGGPHVLFRAKGWGSLMRSVLDFVAFYNHGNCNCTAAPCLSVSGPCRILWQQVRLKQTVSRCATFLRRRL